MKRWIAAAGLLAAMSALGGCVFATGVDGDSGKRIRKLEQRMARAEKQLGIEEAKQ